MVASCAETRRFQSVEKHARPKRSMRSGFGKTMLIRPVAKANLLDKRSGSEVVSQTRAEAGKQSQAPLINNTSQKRAISVHRTRAPEAVREER